MTNYSSIYYIYGTYCKGSCTDISYNTIDILHITLLSAMYNRNNVDTYAL